MTDDKKHADKDRKKISGEDLEDVVGCCAEATNAWAICQGIRKGKKGNMNRTSFTYDQVL